MRFRRLILILLLSGCLPAVCLASQSQQESRIYLTSEQSEIKVVDEGRVELHYYDNVRFRYKGSVLHCDTAVWYEDRDLLEFWGNVTYADSLHNLTSQYLQYRKSENIFIATGACELIDRSESVRIRGETMEFDRDSEELVVSNYPEMAVDYDNPAAIIEITSDTLYYKSQERYGRAIDNVQIVKGTMTATCHLCQFFPDSNLILLESDPFAYQRQNELEGDTMFIVLKDKRIDEIRVMGNGRALYKKEVQASDTLHAESDSTETPPDSTQPGVDSLLVEPRETFTESRIESKTITFFLDNEMLSKIVSAGNSYSWYTPAPEDTLADGKNEASGDSILLFFADGDLDRVEIDNSCVGKFFSQMTRDSLGRIEYLDTVSYESSRLYYNITDRIIFLVGGAEVNNKTITLVADTITYNTTSKDIRAASTLSITDGDEEDDEISEDTLYVPVLLRDGDQEMTGERLVYNLDTKKGKIKESDTQMDKAYYHGQTLRKVEEEVLYVDCGEYIPCEYRDANFYFWSRKMKIINGDKVIAKPVVLVIERIPVLYAPFFVFSIKKGRHSGFLPFKIGSWERGGRYVDDLGYYWAISDYWDLETSMYARENVGVGFRGTANYKKRYVMSGTIKGSYARDASTSFGGRSISNRWSLSANHSHTLSPTASISASGSFVSDSKYTTDVSNKVDERLNRNLRSYLSFSKRWEGSSLTMRVERTEDLDRESLTMTLPGIGYRLNSRTLLTPPENSEESDPHWYHNIRLSYSNDFKNFRSKSKSGDDLTRKEYTSTVQKASVTSPQKILRYLTVSPSLNYTESWFMIHPTDQSENRDVVSDKFLRSWVSSMSVSANTKLYGHFFPPIPGLVGIRHTMTPTTSFSLTPKSDLNAEEASFVGARSSSRQSKSLRVGLSNLFQLKYRSGEEEKKLDLFTLSTSASYNFEAEERKWSTLSSSLRTSSIPVVRDVTVTATHDMYNPVTGDFDIFGARLTRISVSSGISMSGRSGAPSPDELMDRVEQGPSDRTGPKPWSVTFGYRYDESRQVSSGDIIKSITHWITTSARVNLTQYFSVNFSQNYDIRRKTIVSRSINIVRDMRCWEAHFSWNPNGSLKGYYFKIFLKQLPDLKIEKSEDPLRGTLYN